MDKPIISYVIPCYNCETSIFDTIMSIKESHEIVREKAGKKSQWPDIEVICVNDGSTDATKLIIDAVTLENDNVKLITMAHNHGKGISRNVGNTAAKADVIAVLDSDDQNIGDRSNIILKHIGDRDVFYSAFITKHKWTGAEGVKHAQPIDKKILFDYGVFGIGHSTLAYRKEAVLKYPYSENRNKDDWNLLWQFLVNGCNFTYLDEPLVCYMVEKDSFHKQHRNMGLEKHLIDKKKKIMEPIFKEKGWLT